MSVMTRNPDGSFNMPGSPTGRHLGPLQQAPAEPSRPQLQRQAVIDQLGTSEPMGAQPRPSQPASSGAFARGGQVKQLPGSGLGETVGNIAGSTGAQVAGRQLANAGAQTAAGGVGNALTTGASGAAAGAGVGLATGMLADKVRVKEEMPTFGGPNGQYLDEYGRRFEGTGGGTHANAIKYAGMGANPALAAATGGLSILGGALFGIGKAAATRNAPSAYTDFRVEDAAEAVKAAYRGELGREASDDEVMGMLVGQGWDPNGGDRWVGEKGINSVIDHIRASPEAQAYRARGAVVDQLGTGGGATVETSVPAGATREGSMRGDVGLPKQPMPDGAAAPADAAGGPAASAPVGDTSAWNTDGYQAPAYVPPSAGGVPAGWDATKWNDPNHQTPKYGVGRILSNFPPTVEGLKAAMPDIEKAYPGTTFNGKDKITIPGVGTVDVLEAASVGGKAWRWGAEDGGAPAGAASGNANAADSVDLGARRQQPDVIDDDTLARLRAELERIMSGTPDRNALLAQMGGGA